ncbi:hypothetical protein LHYA1_G007313 [Lachnellula hyalina]|uniref:Ubiquitin-like domain-containing protein n=1 Tax=Lachnellula hyalina TaxID=1316788 RepID=A0A8H8QVL1_9HELO|nr:uncharacterized protein LHYA1_G007313 [Lachnellula hyalina]TVY23508.1 hypothetical protein LHYA1_G007313 [Lachnellula hyalina]
MAGDIAQAVIAQVAEAAEGVAFFSRSSEIFPQRLAEEEQRRQKKALKLERKRSSASLEKEPSPQEEKRRRISKDRDLYSSDEDAGASSARREATTSTPGSGSRKSRSASAQKNQASPTSLAVRYSRDLRAAKKEEPVVKPETKGYISLSESDDEDVKPIDARNKPIILDDDDIYSVPQKPTLSVDLDPELSDEEFPELLQQARERERLKVLAREKESKFFEEQNHTSNELDDDIFQAESSKAVVDPIIEILVSSQIDGTRPLLVKRKVSQRLRELRLAWCDYQTNDGQKMASEIQDSIFLTWKGKRLYDVTNCKSLNLNIDSSGKISSQGEGVDNGRVHLEAWTEDIFKAYQKKQAAKLQREQDGLGEDEEEVIEEQVVVKRMRLILKSRELGETKMTVKPTTLIQKLINAFRQDKEVAEDQEVSLQVDGEKLDPEEKIEDTELENMDVVEVHIR